MIYIIIITLFSNPLWESLNTAFSTENSKLIMFYFEMNNCSYCDKMERKIWSQSDIQKKISTRFTPVILNISDLQRTYRINNKMYLAKDIAKQLNVNTYPSVLFMDKNGNVKYRLNEYVPKDIFLKMIKSIE
jgi:thioredoxin-related protein